MRLFATDLDGTLIPNGLAKYDGSLGLLFSSLDKLDVKIAYVSGRSFDSIKGVIKEYNLKMPDFIVSRTGTEIYSLSGDDFSLVKKWNELIRHQNKKWNVDKIRELLYGFPDIRLQPSEEQCEFKISYFIDDYYNSDMIKSSIYELLEATGINAELILLKNDDSKVVYLDILPFGVNQLDAINFIVNLENFEEVIFAGDAEDDLGVFNSDIKTILVKNASNEVKSKIVSDFCYVCFGRGNLNGNYSSGIIEGLMHYEWIKEELD